MPPDVWTRQSRREQIKAYPLDGGLMWLCDELDRLERDLEKADARMDAELENQAREHQTDRDRMNARFWQLMFALITLLFTIIGGLIVGLGTG